VRKKEWYMPRPVVAAVCYSHRSGEIEFLLVRTKGGKRWTFPKGHVEQEPPELPWVAAKREAREEAGVSGSIETKPFTHYPYHTGGRKHEMMVAAYLMRVEWEGTPKEPYRKPQWFTPELAMKKLAERRKEKYKLEYQRVIREALARIDRKID
jgi:8-oxo-dGTP pyrophosphatase MutT (NUDIX family)